MSYFWTFMAGWAFSIFILWLTTIRFRSRHKVIMALLDRAKVYQDRAKRLAREGRDEEALKLLAEVTVLLAQADSLHEKNK